ncbi:MAG: phosphoenolpyruvate carboxykinase (ATP) [Phycisphaeraceae bacterium]|nr:MAG: phosphoenolpyruvate carboxykinase (ATP) [Phycisphaeraceae bacterium]
MTTTHASGGLNLNAERVKRNLSTPTLIEAALANGEGVLASNGAFVVSTGDRTGRSPTDKYLEDSPEIHDKIWWGQVNRPISSDQFLELEKLAHDYLTEREALYVFEGFVGADTERRLGVTTVTEQAWHSLFVQTLFIRPTAQELERFRPDWLILNCGRHKLTAEEQRRLGVDSPIMIAQSLTRKTVIIFGTEYAGEMKKSIFYAMNYDMPDVGVFPMHCSANVAKEDPSNVALFFGLSGTGKTTLSADPERALIGDDEHGWSDQGVFNFEGGCYAKCIKLSKEGEPQIWDAIRFGSVLENVVIDPATRVPDYDDGSVTENTRATYPVEHIPGAVIPSVGGHPKNVIFLTADAFGVLPPMARLSPEQAMYFFINGYTSKLAGTEAGVTEPVPNFSPCFGGPFLARPPAVYAEMLADRIKKHSANVWLLNTGWSGGPYGVGSRFKLAHTRAMVHAILNGGMKDVKYRTDSIFGLDIPESVEGVPDEVLDPRATWSDKSAYDAKAKDLAKRFRDNDAKFDMPDAVRNVGPQG